MRTVQLSEDVAHAFDRSRRVRPLQAHVWRQDRNPNHPGEFSLLLSFSTLTSSLQVSISSSLSPLDEWSLGVALAPLRSEGVLIIAGGLTIHTFDDFSAFSPDTAKPIYKEFEKSIIQAVAVTSVSPSLILICIRY